MKFDKDSYHLLKYIKKHGTTTKADIIGDFLGSGFNATDLINKLFDQNLIAVKDKNIQLSDEGEYEISNLEKTEFGLISKSIFNNPEFALLEFLYNRGYPIHFDDMPDILVKQSPQHGTHSPEGNLYQWLYSLNSLIDEEFKFYWLTDIGKAKYQQMISKKKQPVETGFQYHNIDNSINILGSGNVLNQDCDLHNARVSPTIEYISNTNPAPPNKRSPIEITGWIVGIIAGCIAIYEFIIKKLFH